MNNKAKDIVWPDGKTGSIIVDNVSVVPEVEYNLVVSKLDRAVGALEDLLSNTRDESPAEKMASEIVEEHTGRENV